MQHSLFLDTLWAWTLDPPLPWATWFGEVTEFPSHPHFQNRICFPLKRKIWKTKEDPRVSFFCPQHNSKLKLYISFFSFFPEKSWENMALIHISKIITADPRHLSCCHWNLGKVILVVLQVTNKNILLETNTHATQEIPEGKIENHCLRKKVTGKN